jgi:CubicO group peptidase (beta-lactamase class C family)
MLVGDAFLEAPLLFDPGARWEYGINTDWLGRLVERVSGQTLEAYFQEKIFQPLGMADSFFNVPDVKRSRLVPIVAKNADGSVAQQPSPPAKPVAFFSGGGGLFSTAADYVRFMRALLHGGQLDGRRILSADSVSTMGQNHIGALNLRLMSSQLPQVASNSGVMVGSPDKFGLGFAVNSKPTAAGRSANTMSWAGIYNTFFWIDREKQVAAVFMTQMLPFLEPGVAKVVEEFDRAVYAMRNVSARD